MLTELATDRNAHRALEACTLPSAVDANFVVTLHVMCDHTLSTMLLSGSVDLSKAVDLNDVLVEDLTTARHDELHFDRIWNDASSVCLSCDIKGLNDGTEQTVSSSTKW